VAARHFACLPSSVVSAGGVLVARAGIDDGELGRRRKGNPAHGLVAHVDEQGLVLAAVDRCELVEQPRARSREISLGGMSDAHGRRVVESEIEQLGQRAQECDRERRARSEAGAERKVRHDRRIEPADAEAVLDQDRGHSSRAIRPGPVLALGADLVRHLARGHRCVRREMSDPVLARAGLNCDAQPQRDRHHQSVVVVGVLADQVDPSGGMRGRSTTHSPRTIRGDGLNRVRAV